MTQHNITIQNISLNKYFLWLASGSIFSILSLYGAIFSIPLPNTSLIFYGFAVICMWQAHTLIEWQIGTVLSSQKDRNSCFMATLLANFLFGYTNFVSLGATFYLFPHPIVHKILIVCLYAVGITITCLNGWITYFLYKKQLTPSMKIRHQIFQKEQNFNATRYQKFSEECLNYPKEPHKNLSKNKQYQFFKLNITSYLGRRIANMALWMSLPTWIFVIIPYYSYSSHGSQNYLSFLENSFFDLPVFFQLAATATFIAGLIWLSIIVISSLQTYELSARGLQWQVFKHKKIAFWEQIKKIILQDNNLRIYFFRLRPLTIPLNDIKKRDELLQQLFNNQKLPVLLFFIAEPMWNQLQKKKIHKNFLKQYKEEKLSFENSEKNIDKK